MPFEGIIVFYSENYINPINTLRGQNAELLELKQSLHIQVSPATARFTLRCFAIALLPKPTAVQYCVADFSVWTLTLLCNSVSAVSLSALFFWKEPINSAKWGIPVVAIGI
jgi:hypothetical protein